MLIKLRQNDKKKTNARKMKSVERPPPPPWSATLVPSLLETSENWCSTNRFLTRRSRRRFPLPKFNDKTAEFSSRQHDSSAVICPGLHRPRHPANLIFRPSFAKRTGVQKVDERILVLDYLVRQLHCVHAKLLSQGTLS